MDKKTALIIVSMTMLTLLCGAGYLYYTRVYSKAEVKGTATSFDTKKQVTLLPTTAPTPIPQKVKTSIFVPYWSLPKEPLKPTYDRVFYFGVNGTTHGINRIDEGYKNIEKFMLTREQMPTYLTIKMLDTDVNVSVLKSPAQQKQIIEDSVAVAKKYNFDGILLDFEYSGLPLSPIKESISSFVKDFNIAVKQQNMVFMETMYGDVFYRQRPFDVKFLSENTDELLIMAYDLHKPNGEAGPNFPLAGKEKFNYDYHTLINDFKQVAPPDKITVIFGMYGYDWPTNYQGIPLSGAKSISLNDIKSTYLNNCTWKNCASSRDPLAGEMVVSYEDTAKSYSSYHKIWYEDEKSVQLKKNFLKENGITSTGYWVYGYFN